MKTKLGKLEKLRVAAGIESDTLFFVKGQVSF